MKKIGLVGGMTPESTKEYYDLLIRRARTDVVNPLRNPVILIYSIDLAELVKLQRAGQFDAVAAMLAAVLEKLRGAGAEVGAVTANTPHAYFDAIADQTRLPLVSIIEATTSAVEELGIGKALLLGTQTTMESPMYPAAFERAGMEVVVPEERDQEFIDGTIFDELSLGQVNSDLRQRYLEICREAIARHGVQAVILGCTELPMVLKDGDLPLPLIDTARVHVDAILKAAGVSQ